MSGQLLGLGISVAGPSSCSTATGLAEVTAHRLAELVTDAWRMRAPRELAAEFENDRPP